MRQQYTSKDTSLNQICKVYKQRQFPVGSRVLDYGGGRYDAGKEFMAQKGVKVAVYDKFNRTPEHNAKVLAEAKAKRPDYVVCANVLNVIAEDDVVDEVIRDIASYGTRALFCVYEGNRSGEGKVTNKGYQRNAKTSAYIPMLEKYFQIVSKSKGILECVAR